MPLHFVLISRFRLHTGAEAVWRLLTDIDTWPQWWPYVAQVHRLPPPQRAAAGIVHAGTDSENPVGSVAEIDWRSALVYGLRLRVTTTRAQRPHLLEGQASGDLHGSGLWLIDPVVRSSSATTPARADAGDEAVDVTYRWEVELRRPWMRRLAWLLRPLFAWNHFVVMRAGARGMARRLGCGWRELGEWCGGPR